MNRAPEICKTITKKASIGGIGVQEGEENGSGAGKVFEKNSWKFPNFSKRRKENNQEDEHISSRINPMKSVPRFPKVQDKEILQEAREKWSVTCRENNSNDNGFLFRNHGGHRKWSNIFQVLKQELQPLNYIFRANIL